MYSLIDSTGDKQKNQKELLRGNIEYSSDDSIVFDGNNILLYGNAKISYQTMNLSAAYIKIHLDSNEIYATGMPDSAGIIQGLPVFVDGNDSYESREMRYNFNSRKAIVKQVVTKQADGFLHSEKTKRHENGQIDMYGGKYTTCDLPHPHFYIALTKAKAIPGDKIVSGPAYLVIEDVPIYFPLLPFGFFPNHEGHTSGIIFPTYGEEKSRGFNLTGGGYYFAINDYLDFEITGDIFTKGTWGVNTRSTYRKRYKFNGSLGARYYSNASGDLDVPGDFSRTKDMSLTWSHSQDAKAHPYRRFSGSVNFSTSSFDQNHNYTASSHLRNTKSSNVSFSRNWPHLPFNFSANLSHTQNSINKSFDFKLPQVSFNVSRQYPFRFKNRSGELKWYEKIQLSYSSRLENRMKTTDSLLFNHFEFTEKNYGYSHSIPVSANFKAFKIFNITPNLTYNGVLYPWYVNKYWKEDFNEKTGKYSARGVQVRDTIYQWKYAHAYKPNISISAKPTLYGLYIFKEGMKVQAIRHVFDPSIGFSFSPDMQNYTPDYYRPIQTDTAGNYTYYSMLETGLYGTPSVRGKSGNMNFSLRNDIEMKVRADNDSAQDIRKVKLLNNFTSSLSYNLFADSMNWSTVNFRTSNSFFKGKLNINVGATGDIYDVDSVGNSLRRIDRFVWEKQNSLMRITRVQISTGSSFRSNQGKDNTEEKERVAHELGADYYDDYVDFEIPWNFRFNYSLIYSNPYGIKSDITQTLNFSGDFSLTPKWKIGFNSGWDFRENKLTYSRFTLHRDLHCFEMNFNWVPFGIRQSYNFTIQAKASLLKDLRWNKRKSWYDRGF
ncbi:putative LPS assembly protein LptD [Bacteroidota bacterium]